MLLTRTILLQPQEQHKNKKIVRAYKEIQSQQITI